MTDRKTSQPKYFILQAQIDEAESQCTEAGAIASNMYGNKNEVIYHTCRAAAFAMKATSLTLQRYPRDITDANDWLERAITQLELAQRKLSL
ncbi:hypothetical protein LCGC14_1918820 [marine sediment metagenome]|uniref:Uncharacterized protein n=1 Tax=marine sediment metagenome TaxID=412755 RepID=A0A0F9FS66_9ZZZZ